MAIAFQILAGWFVIDMITGFYHWFIDHRKPTDFLIGKQVQDFQEHHLNQRSMEAFGLVARIWLTTLMSTPALLFAYFCLPAFWLTVFVGGVVCQQSHYWAHTRSQLRLVRWLQKLGVLISPEAHAKHHMNFERCYGILNGWSHGLVDLIVSP